MQSKLMSAVESVVGVTVGLCISFFGNIYILPHWGIYINWEESAQITLLFAAIGVVKNYGLRRLFTHIHTKRSAE